MNFHLPSSDGTSRYALAVEVHDNRAHVFCECAAGMRGKLCKHKLALLQGQVAESLPLEEKAPYKEFFASFKETATFTLLLAYGDAERNLVRAKQVMDDAKQSLESDLARGRFD